MEKTNVQLRRTFLYFTGMNVLAMLAISVYIIADTYFISLYIGNIGVAALNLALPICTFQNALGLMLALGGSTRYSIHKSRGENKAANKVFANTIKLGTVIGLFLILLGLIFGDNLALLLGAENKTLSLTSVYVKTVMIFAPFYILNYIFIAFLRNDNAPKLAMIASASGSISNIFLDYIFMKLFNMGMFGAALATSFAPIIALLIALKHQFDEAIWKIIRNEFNAKIAFDLSRLGISAFIIEFSAALTMYIFNILIIGIAGDTGLAAYGIVANLAFVYMAIFNGISQGVQPLLSSFYGADEKHYFTKILKYAAFVTLIFGITVYVTSHFAGDWVINLFNSDGDAEVAKLAREGFNIYFIAFIFLGFNLLANITLNSSEKVKQAFSISVSRGFLLIVPAAIILSKLLGMTGVWLAFTSSEVLVFFMSLFFVYNLLHKNKN